MERYLLGIDNGGTEIKCALYGLDGEQAASASAYVPRSMPAPGFTERDGAAVWEANAKAIRTVLQKAGVPGEAVAAVGLTGYGNGICLVDAAGAPVYPCIISTDTRAESYSNRFRANGVGHAIYPRTRQNIWAAQPAALLPWFRDNAPDVLARSRWCLGIKDYVRFCLTGEFYTELTEASSTCLCDLDTQKFEPEIFKALGIENCLRLMPPIAQGTAVTGSVTSAAAKATGLAEGTPVAGGYFDIDAGALASGILDEKVLCLIAGTWSINEHLAREANRDPAKSQNTTTLSYLPGYYVVEDSSATSASNFDWFVSNFLAPDRPDVPLHTLYEECDALMTQRLAAGEDSEVVFVPYLFDASAVDGGRAAFFNLAGQHTRADVIQAVYEGVVFSTVLHVNALGRPGVPRYIRARLSGGVTKSSVWTQMMADALQMTIEVPCGEEMSAKGAAMGAGVAVKLFASEAQAVERMVRIGKVYTPNVAMHEKYMKKYARFGKALEALRVFHSEG